MDGCRSKLINVVSGVLQGSVLGLLLFLLYPSELFSILENKLISCGTCHMASLSSSLPRTATHTVFSETILQTCQHQLPQALAALLIATSSRPFKWALFHVTSCASAAHANPLLTTSISSPSYFSTSLPKPRGLDFSLHEDCPENLTIFFYCRNKLLGSNSTSKAQRTS